jgi:hypothetical protein
MHLKNYKHDSDVNFRGYVKYQAVIYWHPSGDSTQTLAETVHS